MSILSESVHSQLFAFSIQVRPTAYGEPPPDEIILAAEDEVSRQRCVGALRAAIYGDTGAFTNDIASAVAITPLLIGMRNLSAFNNVAVLLGRPTASGLDVNSLKQAGLGPKQLETVGFQLWDIIDAGCTATEYSIQVGSYIYATLHKHRVDGGSLCNDGDQPVQVPPEWAIAPAEDDVRFICGQHKWRSTCLVLNDGTAIFTLLAQLTNMFATAGKLLCVM